MFSGKKSVLQQATN